MTTFFELKRKKLESTLAERKILPADKVKTCHSNKKKDIYIYQKEKSTIYIEHKKANKK